MSEKNSPEIVLRLHAFPTQDAREGLVYKGADGRLRIWHAPKEESLFADMFNTAKNREKAVAAAVKAPTNPRKKR